MMKTFFPTRLGVMSYKGRERDDGGRVHSCRSNYIERGDLGHPNSACTYAQYRVVIGLYVCRLGSIPNGAGSMVKYVVSFFSSTALSR